MTARSHGTRGARRGAATARRRISPRHHLARLPGQSLPDESSGREPREQGLRRRRHRSQGQHLRRSAGLREHALQPAVRSAVRAERDRAPRQPGSGSFLAGIVDAVAHRPRRLLDGRLRRLNAIGGGYSEASVAGQGAPPNRLLARTRRVESRRIAQSIDPRIKAAIAIGRGACRRGFWDAEGLEGITNAGALRRRQRRRRRRVREGHAGDLHRRAVNADRYLLTFINAGHNAARRFRRRSRPTTVSETLKALPAFALRRRRVGQRRG